jgi:hypothetical protein
MAQRAYRHRKETTISSLEKRVQDLKGANEEMSNIFISLYDFAVGKGLLDREPEFGRQLQSTTGRFLALAKIAEDDEDNHGESGEKHGDEESGNSKTKGRRASPKKHKETTPPVSKPANPWGGYTLSKDGSLGEEIDIGHQQYQQYRAREDLQVVTRPTEDNASFPFDLMDLQQYRVEVPQLEDYSQTFFPQSQLPLPTTHSYHEFSFARRIHRAAIERGLRLLTSKDPSHETHFQRVFGLSLLYERKEDIEARLRRLHNTSTKESLQEWRAPFVHVGGSGTYYPLHDNDINGDLRPKFRTGYSMGPFESQVAQVQDLLDDDMKCSLPGFEGEFFDSNDVEGYLRGRGLDIPPAADYVIGELDLLALTERPSPRSHSSVTSVLSPRTPSSPILLDGDSSELGKNDGTITISKSLNQMTNTLPYPLAYDSWENNKSMDDNLVDPIFSTMPDRNSVRANTPEIIISDARYGEKRAVPINVNTLIDGE